MNEFPNNVLGQSEDKERIRKRLIDYRLLNEEISNENERYERIEDKIYSLGGSGISDMPKNKGSVYDRISDAVSKKVDLEKRIKKLIAQRDAEEVALENLIRLLEKPNERAVIRMRYLDNEEWEDVQMLLFGKCKDFIDNYENYKQKMFRLHTAALEHLSEHELLEV